MVPSSLGNVPQLESPLSPVAWATLHSWNHHGSQQFGQRCTVGIIMVPSSLGNVAQLESSWFPAVWATLHSWNHHGSQQFGQRCTVGIIMVPSSLGNVAQLESSWFPAVWATFYNWNHCGRSSSARLTCGNIRLLRTNDCLSRGCLLNHRTIDNLC